ncbi:hypothetical protein Axy04_041 [Achromobacter phage vB_AxyP_19-32_Axy04]|uniref:Uncharacterized protein n=1 Tax=Achromobacter phage vB_AxyP_19-32_Axy04 TaxID=2591039 RepID=A0A514CTK4_9CAUD|nr:hypothetical protein KMC55_gp73 [Achromobacter phage vB_AxyP_19-32_Axy04]QDH83807.1 hypothetical protein Axy04_041 [Achromobacter phage vB_AxyP_19-32_Axy04]
MRSFGYRNVRHTLLSAGHGRTHESDRLGRVGRPAIQPHPRVAASARFP